MVRFKKLNAWQRFLLKAKTSEGYKNYKFLEALQPVAHPQIKGTEKAEVHFLHCGYSGDIIYSLPAAYALAEGRPIHLHLRINDPGAYNKKIRHPMGNVLLNEKTVSLLQPLLLYQPQIATCTVYDHQQPIDVDLTAYKQYPFNYQKGHISRWYLWAFGVGADLGKPWLQAPADDSVKDAIVIARSHRYRQPGIDYSFLRQYPRTVFIGMEEEYRDLQRQIPDMEYRRVNDFLEMASVINGSRFFIGNQSAPFAMAEGLKKRRLLEVFHLSPNVIVEGKEGYDFLYQPQFEKLVRQLYEKSPEAGKSGSPKADF